MPQNKLTVVITGADGFLGTALVKHFIAKGWGVVGLVQQAQRHKNTHVRYVEYNLSKPFDETAFKNADYLVHTAFVKYDRQHPDAMDINIEGAKRLLAASQKYKLKKSLFMSSMSAHEEAVSVYGRQKLAIEQLFTANGGVAIRSGLIVGSGGIVQQMAKFMRRRRVVPLIGGGKQPLQVIGIYNLVTAIEKALTKDISGVLTIATPEVYDYKSFYQAIAKRLGIRVWFVPVPFALLLAALRVISFLHLPLSINEDNLWGLKKLRSAQTAADLQKLGLKLDSLGTVLGRTTIID